jgi:hypothetical protein
MRGSRNMSTPVMSVQGTSVSVPDWKAGVTRLSELTDFLLVDRESSVYIILSPFHPSYILTIYIFKIHPNVEENCLLECYAVYLEDRARFMDVGGPRAIKIWGIITDYMQWSPLCEANCCSVSQGIPIIL